MLSNEQIQELRLDLINQKKDLLSQDLNVGSDDNTGDDIDKANAIAAQELSTNLIARNVQQVKLVETALKRIDDGSYGICNMCEEPIEFKRLKARPTTDMCVGCKQEQEKR